MPRERFLALLFFLLSIIASAFILHYWSSTELAKAVFLVFLIFIWNLFNFYFIYKRISNPLSCAILILFIIALPLNITVQISSLFEGFPVEQFYVEGRAVNFLMPYVSIIDVVGIAMVLIEMLTAGVTIFKKYKIFLIGIVGYFIIHVGLHFELVTILSSLRFMLYSFVTIISIDLLIGLFKTSKEGEVQIPVKSSSLSVIGSKLCDKFKLTNMQLISFVVIFCIALFQIIITILQFINGSSLGLNFLGESEIYANYYGSSFFEYNGQSFLRGYGTFPHPNLLGGFLLFLMIISSSIFYQKRVLRYGLNLLMIIGIVFTFSRSALMISLIIVASNLIFDYLYFKNKEVTSSSEYSNYASRDEFDKSKTFTIPRRNIQTAKKSKKSKSSTTRASAFMLPFFSRFADLLNLSQNTDSSISERGLLIEASYQVIKNNLFFGAGWGNFIKSMEGFVPTTFGGFGLFQPVHNIFLLLLSENGIIGLCVIFALLIMSSLTNIKILFQNVVYNKKITVSQYWIIIATISVILISFVDHYLLTLPQGIIILWIFLWLTILSQKSLNEERKQFSKQI